MKLIRNSGTDRVIDLIRPWFGSGHQLDLATSALSVFAFGELREEVGAVDRARLLLPPADADLLLFGSTADRVFRNGLRSRWLTMRMAEWVRDKADVRRARGPIPQGVLVLRDRTPSPQQAVIGSVSFSTEGLGITPGNPLSLIQASETSEEAIQLSAWFEAQWRELDSDPDAKSKLVGSLESLAQHRPPSLVYALILYQLFKNREDALDEETVVKSATGIRNTVVWKKLFKFQRDGVIGAIDKLNRFGGCIIADSVGLGKTFEALAIIKYHELRNDRALVLCPKRLRDNWTLYKANDRRNFLAPDRFNYDVLNHTDLSRDGGLSGDIDLAHVNWGNYDLVVIDESHNFRNKKTPRIGSETRYDRLMRKIIREGVKTRVLMLSATPVNNRMADLRNQIVLYSPSGVQQNDSLTIFDEVRTFEQGGETRSVSLLPLENGNGTVTITLGGASLTHSYRAANPVGLPPTTPAFTTGHSGGACVIAGGFWEADPSDLAQPYGDALASFHIATYGLAGSGSGTIPFVPAAFLDSTFKPCTMRRFSRIWFKNFLQKDAINDCPDPPANTCDRTNQFHVNGARAESSSPVLSGISFHNGNFLYVYGEQIASDCNLASGGCTASKAANMLRWVTDHECGHQFRVNDCNNATNFHDSRPAWCGDLGGACVNPIHLTEKCVMYRGNTPGQDFDFRADGIDHFCSEDLLLGDPTCPLSNPQPGAIRTWEDPQ